MFKNLNSDKFILLAMQKKIIVMLISDSMWAMDAKNPKNLVAIRPEWYIMYKDTLRQLKWN